MYRPGNISQISKRDGWLWCKDGCYIECWLEQKYLCQDSHRLFWYLGWECLQEQFYVQNATRSRKPQWRNPCNPSPYVFKEPESNETLKKVLPDMFAASSRLWSKKSCRASNRALIVMVKADLKRTVTSSFEPEIRPDFQTHQNRHWETLYSDWIFSERMLANLA